MAALVRDRSMEHRGVRYTIRVGIESSVWSIAIHPGGVESAAKQVCGTRKAAEFVARSMIDGWYRGQLKLKAARDAERK
jgi:hypothetical protein